MVKNEIVLHPEQFRNFWVAIIFEFQVGGETKKLWNQLSWWLSLSLVFFFSLTWSVRANGLISLKKVSDIGILVEITRWLEASPAGYVLNHYLTTHINDLFERNVHQAFISMLMNEAAEFMKAEHVKKETLISVCVCVSVCVCLCVCECVLVCVSVC